MRVIGSILLPFAAAALCAQTPLHLDVVGGSTPGTLAMDLYPGLYPMETSFLLVGIDPGPTPIAIVDPNDSRFVNVGLSAIGNSMFGYLGLDGHFRVGPLTVPALPGLVDALFIFQGITFPGTTTFFDRISNPEAIRLGNAGTFRDRGVVMAHDRAFATVLPRVDGRWMVVGGGRGGLLAQTATATTEIYDDLTDLFVPGPTMTTERSLHTMTKLPDGRWLLIGGVDRLNNPQALCEIYDPATDAFTACAPMNTPRTGHTATLLPDGRVFAAGGLAAMTTTPSALYAIFDTTNTTEIYNPATNTWTAGPNLRTPRVGQVAMLRPDGRVLLAGGISWDDFIVFRLPATRNTSDLFTPSTNTIAAGPSMSTPHALIDPVPLGNDRWLVAGGINAVTLTSPGTMTNVAEIYNAAANTWTTVAPFATARGNFAYWSLGGGRVLCVGGANGTITSPVPLASGEVFDTATNAWTAGPTMNIPRTAAAMLLTPRGQVHVLGGGTSNNTIATGTEWYYF
jgi:hypothetical protein